MKLEWVKMIRSMNFDIYFTFGEMQEVIISWNALFHLGLTLSCLFFILETMITGSYMRAQTVLWIWPFLFEKKKERKTKKKKEKRKMRGRLGTHKTSSRWQLIVRDDAPALSSTVHHCILSSILHTLVPGSSLTLTSFLEFFTHWSKYS